MARATAVFIEARIMSKVFCIEGARCCRTVFHGEGGRKSPDPPNPLRRGIELELAFGENFCFVS